MVSLMNSPKLPMYYFQRKRGSPQPLSWAGAGDTALSRSREQDTKRQDNRAGSVGDPFRTSLFSCPWIPAPAEPSHTSLVLLTAERRRGVGSPAQVNGQEPRTGKRCLLQPQGQRLQCCECSEIGKESGIKPRGSAWEH